MIVDEFRALARNSRVHRLRGMLQFAEDEIVLPSGPFAGSRFRINRQPCLRHLFAEYDNPDRLAFAITGPSQSSKTLSGTVIPAMWHLFEKGESVACLVPHEDMYRDKWRDDFLPVIEASRYREFLPRGIGSRGGSSDRYDFQNGTSLRFVSAGGSDKKRAGFTVRVVVMTEVDGYDEAGGKSEEADPIEQMMARTRSFGDNIRIYMESTVTTDQGRIWREYTNGTCSRIVLPCVGCGKWVTPGRDDLVGWQDAESDKEAKRRAAYSCPECSELWTEQQRAEMCRNSRIVHRGQEITPDGEIVGEEPETMVFGFRWSAVDNLLMPAGQVAVDEWNGQRDPDEANAEKKLRQFVWALPYEPSDEPVVEVSAEAIMRRIGQTPRAVVPPGVQLLTAGVDIRKRQVHWLVLGFSETTWHIVDYGIIELLADDRAPELAVTEGLRQWREMAGAGFAGPSGVIPVRESLIDAGYLTHEAVYPFIKTAGTGFRPAMGFGSSEKGHGQYRAPAKRTDEIPLIGDQYHIKRMRAHKVDLVEFNADHWKTQVHERLTCPETSPGALLLYRADRSEHMHLAKHLTAEQQVRGFKAAKSGKVAGGETVKWERRRRDNHWLDCLSQAAVAGHMHGVRLIRQAPASVPRGETRVNLPGRDGRPFFVTARRGR